MDSKTLIESVAAQTNISSADGKKIVEEFAALLSECGAELDSVAVPGFGVFESRKRLERINVHPSTGKRMLLPPKIVMSFKASALLKQKLNKI